MSFFRICQSYCECWIHRESSCCSRLCFKEGEFLPHHDRTWPQVTRLSRQRIPAPDDQAANFAVFVASLAVIGQKFGDVRKSSGQGGKQSAEVDQGRIDVHLAAYSKGGRCADCAGPVGQIGICGDADVAAFSFISVGYDMAVFEYYVGLIDTDIAAGGLGAAADSSRDGTVDQIG